MNTDSSSEGPYKHETVMYGTSDCSTQCRACIYAEGRKAIKIKTPCPSCGFTTLDVDSSGNIVCSFLDCKNPTQIAKAEGRKSMEERTNGLIEAAHADGVFQGRKAAEKDFRELLEFANGMQAVSKSRDGRNFGEFNKWKKARGIE